MQRDLIHALEILGQSRSVRQNFVEAGNATPADREYISAVDTVFEFIYDIFQILKEEVPSCKQ